MKIMFCGASNEVTGSCHLISTDKHKVLLDCGQFQGGKAMEAKNYDDFPFNPAELECLVLSHAHIDHCGRIPLLIKRGFKGKIYCTKATAELVEIMLKDSGYIHEKEAEYANKKADRKGGKHIEPLYTYNDALDALNYLEPVLYDQLVEINEDIKICFNDAGHILGSSIVEIWVKENDKKSKIVFSGDLGMRNRPILRDPKIIKKADYLIMETTYGNRVHEANRASVKGLIDIIMKTAKRGGSVIIPAFAVGRTQELIFELNRFYEDPENREYQEQLDKINVYVDSPMATSATQVFRANAQDFDEETKAYILKGDNPLDFKNLKFTRSSQESMMLNADHTPKIIISASGMCEAGRIRHHLKHNLWDARNSIVFVGYQAEGSLGRLLVEGAESVVLFGEEIKVAAEIYNLEGFSGHADRDDLIYWLRGFQQKPKQIFLVHGEPQAKIDFAETVKKELGYDCVVVKGNSEYELVNDDIVSEAQIEEDQMDGEDIDDLRARISRIHDDMETILYNTHLSASDKEKFEKLSKIRNLVLELERNTMSLGSAVTESYSDNIEAGDIKLNAEE